MMLPARLLKQNKNPRPDTHTATRSLLTTPALALLLIFTLSCGLQLQAQEEAPLQEPEIVPDKYDRGTPAGTAKGFLLAADRGDFETAAEYLDLRNLMGKANDFTGAQLARRLEVIVTRADWIDIDDLVDDPMGREGDGLPGYRDSIGVLMHEGQEVRMLMQRVPRGDGEFIWKISNATVSQIPQLYETYGYGALVEKLRRILPQASFLGFELFKWAAGLIVGAIVYAAVFLLALGVRRALGNPDSPANRRIFRFLVFPFSVWAVIVAMNWLAEWLGRGVTAEAIVRVSPVPTLITLWVLFAAVNLFREIYREYLDKKGRFAAQVLIRPASNAIKLLIFVGALLFYLDSLGVNITTMMAGLGIGGVAVALALQKPMEDVFGAITLYSQQPVRVGDFCTFGTMTGTIEEIGLRTTFVRTLANTRIAIPNARLATEAIENISARQKILYRPSLRLRYDTRPAQIEAILEGIRDLLEKHPHVLQDNHRVRFVEIANDALRIEVYAYLGTSDWAEYLELAEDLNLKLLEIVSNAGTSLSLPARSMLVEQRPEAKENA